MATSARGSGIVGYNVQAAVDAKHHLIVTHEVTNVGHDRHQLASMAQQSREALGQEQLTALADRGYFNGEELLECEQHGINALVPKPLTSGSKAHGRFDKRDFIYDPQRDEYECPAGEHHRFISIEDGLTIHKYWSSACLHCPIKQRCTTSKYRRIARWEHEDVVERAQQRLEQMPEASRITPIVRPHEACRSTARLSRSTRDPEISPNALSLFSHGLGPKRTPNARNSPPETGRSCSGNSIH